MRRALVVVGKAPRPGHSKTRLAAVGSDQQVAELARAFLLDTLALALALGWEQVSLVHPAADGPSLAALVPPAVHLVSQPRPGLGSALAHAFTHHLEQGFERVVLIGSDTPHLSRTLLETACAALDSHDVSLGPCADGGYYLLALKQRYARLFEDIAWSTPRVYAQTRARAAELRLRVHTLPLWHDVDSVEDLAHLQHDLASAPARTAPRTRAVLEQLSLVSRVRMTAVSA